MRPTPTQVLDMHNVQNNLSETLANIGNHKRACSPGVHSNNSLLGTIKVPRQLRNVKQHLPKSKYESNNPPVNQEPPALQRIKSAQG